MASAEQTDKGGGASAVWVHGRSYDYPHLTKLSGGHSFVLSVDSAHHKVELELAKRNVASIISPLRWQNVPLGSHHE